MTSADGHCDQGKTKKKMDIKMPGKIRVVLSSNEKEKHAKRMRNARKEWSEEQKEKNRELSRLRMKAYRERKKKKQNKTDDSHKMATRHEQKIREEKNRKLAEYRRKYRANLSSQKKRRIREKDATRKREKRLRDKKASTQPKTVINSLSGQSQYATVKASTQPKTVINSLSSESQYATVSALKKAVYRAKKRLPKSPQKFAEVVSGIVTNATPKKKQALKMKGLDSMEAQKDLNNVLQSLKEVDQGMRGKDKISRMKRKSFIGSLSTIVKKRRGMNTVISAALGIHRKYFSHGSIREPKKRKDCISKETEESIQNFFCKDNVSINLPNKKNIKKDAVESRVLQGTLDTMWSKWKDENPDKHISFDKFTKLKPKEVKTQKHRKYLQCLCEYCENLRLKLETINKLALTNQKPQLKMKSIHEALELTLCPKTGPFHCLQCVDRACGACGPAKLRADLQAGLEETDLEWKKWALQVSVNKRTGKEIKKKELTVIRGKTSELIEELVKDLLFMSKHLFEANWQILQFGILIKNLPPTTIALAIDFAENYLCTSQNEVQSAHWSKESVTIHPTVVYYQCPDCPEDIVEECCDVISDDLTHDAHAVNAFLHKIFTHLKEKRRLTITKAFIMSDGCASQYKSKIPFSDAANAMTEFGFIIQRDYYGSRHGKNRCDGEGGVLKSRVARAVKNAEAEIVSASDFYTFCRDHLQKDSPNAHGKCIHKRRHLFFVSLEDIKRQRPERNVRTVQGTQKIHSLVGVEREIIKTRRLSCFCQNCLFGWPERCQQKDYVDQWKPVRLKYLQHPGNGNRVQPTAGEVQAQPPADEVQVQPVADEVQVQPPADVLQVQPVTDEVQVQPPADEVQIHPPADEVQIHPPAGEVQVQPPADEVQVQPVADEVQVQPPADVLQVQPVTDEVQVQPPADEVQIHPPADEVQIHPPADEVQVRPPADVLQVQPPADEVQVQLNMVNLLGAQFQPVQVQPLDVQVQPLDVQVQSLDSKALSIDIRDLDGEVQSLADLSVLDYGTDSEKDRVECSFEEESDVSNSMDISGLTGILDALDEEHEDMSLSPILSLMKDAEEKSPENKEPRPGEFLKIKFGNSVLPAVVDQWPFIHYFKRSAKGWAMQEIRHTIIYNDIDGRLKAPSVESQGRRVIYKFEELDS